MLRKRTIAGFLVVMMATLVLNTAHAATVGIDDFVNTTLATALFRSSGTTGAADGDALVGVLGGERDLTLTHISGSGSVSLDVDTFLERLSFASAPGTRGNFSATWDGNDDTAAVLAFGLGADLTDTAVNDNLMISVYADQVGWTMTVNVYTDATNFSTFTFTENEDIRSTGRVYLMPFANFVDTNAGANFGAAGAVEILVTGVDDLDMTIQFFESVDIDANLFDFGDLPAGYGMTTVANNGGGHLNPGTTIRMGTLVDGEADGVPSADATGDGVDEDGVVFTGLWNDNTGHADVTITGSVNGCLSAWLDWHNGGFVINPDGDFDDALEKIIDNEPVTAGVNSFTFNVLDFDSAQTLFARFRVVPDRNNDGLCTDQDTLFPTGLALDGEVEDYEIGFLPTAVNLQNINANNQSATIPFAIGAFLLILFSAGIVYSRKRQVAQ